MGQFKKALLGAAVVVAASASLVPAHAYVITSPTSLALISLAVGDGTGFQTAATRVGANSTTTFSGSTGSQNGYPTGIYSGTNSNGAYTSPFGAGNNQDYYAVQPGGSIVITYNLAQTSFGLLFGTVDSYNSLSFSLTNANGTQTTITGTQVMNAIGGSANGMSNRYVLISGLSSFNTVTATDTTQSAFEFVPASVPEPMSLAVLGAGLVGMGALRRRSAK